MLISETDTDDKNVHDILGDRSEQLKKYLSWVGCLCYLGWVGCQLTVIEAPIPKLDFADSKPVSFTSHSFVLFFSSVSLMHFLCLPVVVGMLKVKGVACI